MSSLADQVGHGTFAVMPLFDLIERHVLAAKPFQSDGTTIRIPAKNKCTTGKIWTYVRDDRPLRRACAAGGGLIRLERPWRGLCRHHG